ncbi:LADA_0H15324g1_1 [Lachancea dasiensis]|uniref:LADA_0H15324g1_1 n=1 Tax=Lachancea dasiensis TaxID=1072105 RepID=A0A1G4K4T3_9SACH|nr:LADA_0H15324g1_1 [Lachancea dasiensis]
MGASNERSGSCLVCRKRKVKCDRAKPVCQTCVRHNSVTECRYDVKKSIKFLHMFHPDSGTLSKGKRRLSKTNHDEKCVQMSSKIPFVEGLSQSNRVPEASMSSLRGATLDPFGEMSFHEDYEAIEIKASRLTYAGPLHYAAVSRRDPFLNVIFAEIRREMNHLREKALKANKNKGKKYPLPFYTQDEIANHLLVSGRHSPGPIPKDNGAPVASLLNRARAKDRLNRSKELNTGANTLEEDSRTDDKFKKKLLENEGMDETLACDSENLERNPLSVVNLLNEDNTNRPSLGSAERGDKDKSTEIEIWRKLQVLLAKLQERTSKGDNHIVSEDKNAQRFHATKGYMMPAPEFTTFSKIKGLLPSSRLIWKHLDNYFKSPLHALYPILTEDWFCDDISDVIGKRSDSDLPPVVTITSRLDFSKLGTLLLLLRFSYLMYSEKCESRQSDEEKALSSHPIGAEFADTAYMCLNLFKLQRKALLAVLHCALLLHLYRRFAPEEGDIVDGGDIEPFSSLICGMATSIGLNTEIDFTQLPYSGMYLQAWRKCWYTIYFMDLHGCMNSGNSLKINEHSFNTKLPRMELDGGGSLPKYVKNAAVEAASVECLAKNFELSHACRRLLDVVMNRQTRTRCSTVQYLCDELESSLALSNGSGLRAVVNKPCSSLYESALKCNAFKNFIDTTTLLSMVTFHMFLHIDKCIADNNKLLNNTVLQDYLGKLLMYYVEVEPILILILADDEAGNEPDVFDVTFGRGSKLLIMQCCGSFIVHFAIILQCFVTRLKHLKLNYKDDLFVGTTAQLHSVEERKGIIDDLIELCFNKLSLINSITKLLSRTHFYAWRMSKSYSHVYHLLEEKSILLQRPYDNGGCQAGREAATATLRKRSPFGLSSDKVPTVNNLASFKTSDFQQLLSILSSTDWEIFSSFLGTRGLYSKDLLLNGVQRSIKTQAHENNRQHFGESVGVNQAERTRSSTLSSKPVSSESVSKVEASLSTGGLNEQAPDDTENYVALDAIDTFWYSAMLRNANISTDLSYPKDGFHSHALNDALPDHSHSERLHENASQRETKSSTKGLDELSSDQTLLQERVLQQLRQLTSEEIYQTSKVSSHVPSAHEGYEKCEAHDTKQKPDRSAVTTDVDMFFPPFSAFIDDMNFN